ncbi:MAG: internal scaffolding protein [Microvirus sp.]|nr:MAG: internal scaffolding protein [Microvirus sp.]
MNTIFLRTPHNYDTDKVSEETGLTCTEEESLVQQQFAEETNINEIVRRFGITHELPHNPRMPSYGDFTGVTDFQSALHAVQQAENDFAQLPAAVRARFQNDPQELLQFISDDRNRPEAETLGLVKPKPTAPGTQEPKP